MKTYSIAYRYSRDGKSWTVSTTTVKASSESAAIAQVRSRYKYVENIRIMSVK